MEKAHLLFEQIGLSALTRAGRAYQDHNTAIIHQLMLTENDGAPNCGHRRVVTSSQDEHMPPLPVPNVPNIPSLLRQQAPAPPLPVLP